MGVGCAFHVGLDESVLHEAFIAGLVVLFHRIKAIALIRIRTFLVFGISCAYRQWIVETKKMMIG